MDRCQRVDTGSGSKSLVRTSTSILGGRAFAQVRSYPRTLLAPIFHAGVWMGNRERCKELSDRVDSCVVASPGRGAPITQKKMNAGTTHDAALDVAPPGVWEDASQPKAPPVGGGPDREGRARREGEERVGKGSTRRFSRPSRDSGHYLVSRKVTVTYPYAT